MKPFEQAFRRAQDALGLAHYDVRFASEPGSGNYASIEPDPASCTAICRVDFDLCEREGQIDQVAVHEALHLLLAELRHAAAISDEAADWVEETIVRRIVGIVYRGIQ